MKEKKRKQIDISARLQNNTTTTTTNNKTTETKEN